MARQLVITHDNGFVDAVPLDGLGATVKVEWQVQTSPDVQHPESKTFSLEGVDKLEIVTGRKAEKIAEAVAESQYDATDAAIKAADDAGIDLATVEGTGADGRITVDDVKAAVAAQA